MTKLYKIVFILLVFTSCNPFWIHIDKRHYKKFTKAYKSNPKSIENFFITHGDTIFGHDMLGFGWRRWETKSGGGYVSIRGIFYYHNDSIYAYSIIPEIPEEKFLIKKYKKRYKIVFPFTSNDSILNIEYNTDLLTNPINYNIDKSSLSKQLTNYMSPESGTRYGCKNGSKSWEFLNRKHFNRIKNDLSPSDIIILMHSLNPASRFTAIEYYFENKDKFSSQMEIESWISTVLTDYPKIQTYFGDKWEFMDTEELVKFCSQDKN
ncbi:MAG TPA: hypothetical protein VK177_04655 [Flavobacteriales bacterium]|nr:hypothetical protein [Flavobacteriales bacterium]